MQGANLGVGHKLRRESSRGPAMQHGSKRDRLLREPDLDLGPVSSGVAGRSSLSWALFSHLYDEISQNACPAHFWGAEEMSL